MAAKPVVQCPPFLASLRVFSSSNDVNTNTFTEYMLKEGETTIGGNTPKRRGAKSHNSLTLSLPFASLSKEHCRILIDNKEHFIMALTNDTQRNTHSLRPNVYYELTEGVQLTLGCDVHIHYHILETKETKSSTATPSPRSVSPLPHFSPFALHLGSDTEQDNNVNNNMDEECTSPLLLQVMKEDSTQPYDIHNEYTKEDNEADDDDDQTLPFDSPPINELPNESGMELTLAYELDHKDSPTDTATECSGPLASLLEEDTTGPPLIEPTIAYELQEQEEDDTLPAMSLLLKDESVTLAEESNKKIEKRVRRGGEGGDGEEDSSQEVKGKRKKKRVKIIESSDEEYNDMDTLPTANVPTKEELPNEPHTSKKPLTEEPPSEPPTEEPPTEESPTEESPTEESPSEEPPTVPLKRTHSKKETQIAQTKSKKKKASPSLIPEEPSTASPKEPRIVIPEELPKKPPTNVISEDTVVPEESLTVPLKHSKKEASVSEIKRKKKNVSPSPIPEEPPSGSMKRTHSKKETPTAQTKQNKSEPSSPIQEEPSTTVPVRRTRSKKETSITQTKLKKSESFSPVPEEPHSGPIEETKETLIASTKQSEDPFPLSEESEESTVVLPDEPIMDESSTVSAKRTQRSKKETLTTKTKRTKNESPSLVRIESPTNVSDGKPPIEEPPTKEPPSEKPSTEEPLTEDPSTVPIKRTRSKKQTPIAQTKSKKKKASPSLIPEEPSAPDRKTRSTKKAPITPSPIPEEPPTSTVSEETPTSTVSEEVPTSTVSEEVPTSTTVQVESETEEENPLNIDTCTKMSVLDEESIVSSGTVPPSKRRKLKQGIIHLNKISTSSENVSTESVDDASPSTDKERVVPGTPGKTRGSKTSSMKSTRSSTDSPLSVSLPQVMFTKVVDQKGEGTVKELGGHLVQSAIECTHCVTDKVRRTVKFLCCLAKGCDIVSTKWLDRCRSERKFVSTEPFTIKDNSTEKQYQFSLRESIAKARESPLLKGWSIYLTDNIKPCPTEMSDIIKCAGGKVIKTLPEGPVDNVFIISCDQDLSMVIGDDIPVCSNEVILTGILKQQLELDKYQLEKKSTAKRRRR